MQARSSNPQDRLDLILSLVNVFLDTTLHRQVVTLACISSTNSQHWRLHNWGCQSSLIMIPSTNIGLDNHILNLFLSSAWILGRFTLDQAVILSLLRRLIMQTLDVKLLNGPSPLLPLSAMFYSFASLYFTSPKSSSAPFHQSLLKTSSHSIVIKISPK
jgi:hypothetical protein